MANDGKNSPHPKVRRGFLIAIFILIILMIILLLQLIGVWSGLAIVANALQALLFGILFACLLNPVMNGFVNIFTKWLAKPDKPRRDLINGLSAVMSVVILLAIIVFLLLMVIPQLGSTISELSKSFNSMVENFNDWIRNFSTAKFWQERIYPAIESFTSNISTWVLDHFGAGSQMFTTITSGIMSIITIVLNMFVGMILAIYLLMGRDKIFAQIRKLVIAIFRPKYGGYIMEGVDAGVKIFSGYFAAKVIEALIMGVLCFVGMVILQIPYGTLISVIVGISNISPFFGAYVGTIIGAALLVLSDPWAALIFIILQIVLIQLDGNLIGPKIMGRSTGLPALWVIVSILFFGGCFGFVGTIVGVPIFAWIYYIVKRLAEHSLARQGELVETENYYEAETDTKAPDSL